MSFQFRLDSLLRIRQGQKRMEEQALARLFSRRDGLVVKKNELQQNRNKHLEHAENAIKSGVTAVELAMMHEQERLFARALQKVEAEMAELLLQIKEQRSKYAAARREEERLQQIRENAQEAWAYEQQRREQSIVDGLYLAQRWRLAKAAQTL